MGKSRWLILLMLVSLLGCHMVRPTPLVVPKAAQAVSEAPITGGTLVGKVDFGTLRSVQATPNDVLGAATVSFIETGTNQTVATGRTDASGAFSLSLGSYAPTTGATYLLEAVKGLNAQAPGSNAARFRTLLQWNGTGWLSCTNSAVGGSIVINALTTALAIESYLDPANVPPANTIGKVNVSTNPATLNASPGPYTNHPDTEISQLAADLINYLGTDADPVASVPSILPSVASFTPSSGAHNSLIRIQGSGFSPVPSGNTVTVNGTPAQVILATATSLVVIVPSGATTGTIRVQTGRGTATGASFTVTNAAGSIAVTGMSPAEGRADTVVAFTGQFGSGTATPSVVFGGGVEATVTAWTQNAMTVIVPVGATPGQITVRSGIVSAASPGSFQVAQGNLSWMSTLTPVSSQSITPYTLPYPRHGHALATYGSPARFAYVIAGWNGSTTTNDVVMFPVNADGSLGTMRTAGRLNTRRYHHAAAIVGNYLYVFGGHDGGSTYLTSIERASINPTTGSLSSFTTIGNLAVARHEPEAIANGTTIYVLGGSSNVAPTERNDYERYTVNTTTGALTLANTGSMLAGGVAFSNRSFGHAIVGNYLVMVSGYLNSSYSAASVVIPINADGTLGNGAYGPSLNQAYYSTQMAVINNELYVFSGHNGSNYHTAVAHAPFNPSTGAIGAWVYDSPPQLFPSTYTGQALVAGNRLYTFGGYGNVATNGLSNAPTTYIQTAVVNADRSLSRWTQLAGLQYAIHGNQGTVIGNKAWVIGGYNYALGTAIRTTQYFTIGEDGSLGPSTPGPNLNLGRWWAASAVANGYLYIIGASSNSSGDTIERAVINPDGTLGSFVTLPNRLTQPNYVMAYAQIGNYIYLFGGHNGARYLDTIERAELLPDGSMGQFERLPQRLPGALYAGQAAVGGNYVYLNQGYNGSGYSAEVWMARINPDGSIGHFEAAPSLPQAGYTQGFRRIGNYLYSIGGWAGGVNGTTYRALINPNGMVNPWETVAPNGRPVLPIALSHWNAPPYVYKNFIFMFGGYNGVANSNNNNAYNCDWIHAGTIN